MRFNLTPDFARLIKGIAAPAYRGRKFRAVIAEKVRLSGLNWEGGSRSTYCMVDLERREIAKCGDSASAPWINKDEGSTWILTPGLMAVEHSIFCGKDMGLRVYMHPMDALVPNRIVEVP